MSKKNIFKDTVGGLLSLLIGLKITIKEFFKKSITLQYPHQSLKMTERYRGHIELVRDPETGKAVCIACKVCEKACPSDCITVEGMKFEGDKRKSVTAFKLDFTKCSLCGSCIEACKSEAIEFSKQYNQASVNKEDFIFDLLKYMEKKKEQEAQ
jgi:NADH-quinone oxidoreductase subunit I